jgi:hypothetical protein
VRKVSHGEGVERVFQTFSPTIAGVTVKRRGDVRRAKLYYLRDRAGTAARIQEKICGLRLAAGGRAGCRTAAPPTRAAPSRPAPGRCRIVPGHARRTPVAESMPLPGEKRDEKSSCRCGDFGHRRGFRS